MLFKFYLEEMNDNVASVQEKVLSLVTALLSIEIVFKLRLFFNKKLNIFLIVYNMPSCNNIP